MSGNGVRLFSGSHNILGTLHNTGTLVFESNPFVTGPGTLTSTGTLLIPPGSFPDIETTVTSEGTTDIQGQMFVNNAGVLINKGVINLPPEKEIGFRSGTAGRVELVNGVIDVRGSGPAGPAVINVPVRTNMIGFLDVQDATLALRNGGTFSIGLATLKQELGITTHLFFESGEFVFDEGFSLEGQELVDGHFRIGQFNSAFGPVMNITDGERLNVNFPTEFRAGLITGTGTLRNESLFTWWFGQIDGVIENRSSLVIPPAAGGNLLGSITNKGSVFQNGRIDMNGATITNEAGLGAWNLLDGGSIFPFGGGGLITNQSTITAIPELPTPVMPSRPRAQPSTIAVTLDNTGTVEAENTDLYLTGQVLQYNPLTGGLSGGEWVTLGTGRIIFQSGPIRRIVDLASLTGSGTSFPGLENLESIENGGKATLGDTATNGPVTNFSGEMTVDGAVSINGDYTATNGSKTTVKPGGSLQTTGNVDVDTAADDLQGISVVGRGAAPAIVANTINLAGSITVGELAGDSTLDAQADLVMTDTARLRVGLRGDGGGSNSADRLALDGNASLDGTLVLTENPGLAPADGERFVVLTATSITGAFDAIDGPCNYTFEQTPTEVRVVYSSAPCGRCNAADLAAPFGVLDLSDINAFVNAFTTGDPAGDLDGNGILDLTDINVFVGAFLTGCP